MTTILDVIDNFFYQGGEDVRRIPARRLLEFGAEVRRFAGAHESERVVRRGAQYLGGWPSAGFTDVGAGVLHSSLLLTEQIIVKDPVTDWFSDDLYANTHKLASAPGWSTPGDGPNIAYTRHFLANVLPALQEIRPLIDAGLVVLIPMERLYARHTSEIEEFHERLIAEILNEPLILADRFAPSELAHDDALRGMFVVAGGEWEEQTHKAFSTSLFYFAREYLTAKQLGGTYCAPFAFERFVCAEGVGHAITRGDRVRACILNSELPVFEGLTPQLMALLHEDEHFGQIRTDLHRIYGDAPIDGTQDELRGYIHEQEEVHLRPLLDRAKREADRGLLKRLGLALRPMTFKMAAGIGLGVASGSLLPSLLSGAAMVTDQFLTTRRDKPAEIAWTALLKHGRAVTDEMPRVAPQDMRPPNSEEETRTARNHPWGIPAQASMSVTVTSGVLRANWLPVKALVQAPMSGYQEGVYQPCSCGSGLKYRFCCQTVDKRYGRDSLRSPSEE